MTTNEDIYYAYYKTDGPTGRAITFVRATSIEVAVEYLERVFGDSLISVQKYVRPQTKNNLKK